MGDIYCMCFDGLGGSLMTVSVASIIARSGIEPIILCPMRDEVFKPFQHLIRDRYKVLQLPEGHADLALKYGKEAIIKDKDAELYIVYPDGLYLNPLAFDYKKYNTSPHVIKSQRVLTHKFAPKGKQIYVGLISSTQGYLYPDIPKLLRCLSDRLPDYDIHCPVISKWAGIDIKMGDFSGLPANVHIHQDPDFLSQIDLMAQCEYGIYTDNGSSHIAYHFGQIRLLIDPRFGYGRESLMWRVRWRQTEDDSIRFESFPEDIADLVKINIKIPQTTLIPKQIVMNNKHADWSRELLFKY